MIAGKSCRAGRCRARGRRERDCVSRGGRRSRAQAGMTGDGRGKRSGARGALGETGPEDRESGGLEKKMCVGNGRSGRKGGPGATFSRGRAKKIPGPLKRAGAKRRSRLHRRVHTGISGQRYFGKLNDDKPKETNSSRGKVVCGVVAIKIFTAKGDEEKKEDRAKGCACRSEGRFGRGAGRFGCRLPGQFWCRSVGQVVCRYAVAGGNRRRLPGRCTWTTGRGDSVKGSLWGKVATGALPETKWYGTAG